MAAGNDANVVVGLSFGARAAAVAVVVDGEVAAAQEERVGREHRPALPAGALRACLEVAGIDAADVDEVVYHEKPLVVLTRFLAARQRQGPSGMSGFVRDAPALVRHNLGLRRRVGRLMKDLGCPRPPALRFSEHQRSHAAAAFYPSPHDDAAVLTVDGLGEWATVTIGRGTGNRVVPLEELRFPDSVGLLYSFVTAWCGLRPDDDEPEVMGLAPYGEPVFEDALGELAQLGADGGVRVDGRRLAWFSPAALRSADLADALGGPPRAANAEMTQREADLAASVQRHTEAALLAMAQRAFELTGEGRLCLGGEVAFNDAAIGRVEREGPFESLWVPPAAGDAGNAVGAALWWWHDAARRPRPRRGGRDGMSGALLGAEIDGSAARAALDAMGVAFEVLDATTMAAAVAAELAGGAVVGWVQGRMEFGPRALGNRSILADPRDPHNHRRLQESVSGHESFRPFAAAVLAERVGDWFELEAVPPGTRLVGAVRSERLVAVGAEPAGVAARRAVARSTIPAVTHVDGSVPVLAVGASSNPQLAALLSAFDDLTGCPLLLNAAFAVAGEAVVGSVPDAVRAATAGGLDLLVIGDLLVRGDALAAR